MSFLSCEEHLAGTGTWLSLEKAMSESSLEVVEANEVDVVNRGRPCLASDLSEVPRRVNTGSSDLTAAELEYGSLVGLRCFSSLTL